MVNGISKTSVPKRWSDYINKEMSNLEIEMVSIDRFQEKIWKCRKEEYIVHGHHIKAMALFMIFNFFLNKNTLYTLHGSYHFLSKTNQFLLRFIFKWADKIVFVNQVVYEDIPESIKVKISHKCDIILNGIENSYDYKKTDIYDKFNINADDTLIFHPARFVEEKNHLRLIDAIKSVIDKDKRVKLLLAGSGVLEDKIRQRIQELDLSENVVFLGLIQRDEVYCFLESCDLFVMPSISEGLNIAFLEAVSMKCKVLVSDIASFTYPFKHYDLMPSDFNIRFVDPLDSALMAKNIENALADEKKENFDFSKFSLENMVSAYFKIYKQLQ